MKALCKYCNNSNKITDGKKDIFICLGDSSEDRIKEFEKDARALKEEMMAKKRYYHLKAQE